MIQDSMLGTRQLHLEPTCALGPRGDEARSLRIAVRRCVRNAAGQPSPRNQFERYVADRLRSSPPLDRSGHLAALADELCRRVYGRPLPDHG